jgi:hypothetical protein
VLGEVCDIATGMGRFLKMANCKMTGLNVGSVLAVRPKTPQKS